MTGLPTEADSIHLIRYGREEIPFRVSFGERKALRIIVHPDLTVTVRAPHGRSLEEVLSRVEGRARWIIRQRRYFEQFLPRLPAKRYVSGETIVYLGRQYRLKVIPDACKLATLRGQFLEVRGPRRTDRDAIKSIIDGWHRDHARAAFERRLSRCWESAKRYGISLPVLRIRRMTKRWGSCGKNGAILLNTELIRAPVHCIDYVIMHELCHLRWPHHQRAFYRLLSSLMPDWEKRKSRLEQVMIQDD